MRGITVVVASLSAIVAVCAVPAAGQEPSRDVRSYVFLAQEEFRTQGIRVEGGHLGVNDGSFFASGPVLAPNSELVANAVRIDGGTTCAQLFSNMATGESAPGCSPPMSFANPIVQDLAAECGFPDPFPACDPDRSIRLSDGSTLQLPPGVYGHLDVLGGGGNPPSTVVLTGGNYVFCSVRFGRNNSFLYQATAVVNVAGDLEVSNETFTGPAPGSGLGPQDLDLFVNGASVHFARQSVVVGFMCAPNAVFRLTAGTAVIGSFLANVIRTERIFVTTTTTATTTTQLPSTVTTTTTTTPLPSTVTTTTIPGLDHFLCYLTNGTRDFTVTLSDQFDTGTYSAFHKQVLALCTPAEKNDEPVVNPLTHLKVYRIKGPHVLRKNVQVTNQFGTFLFDTTGNESLMVPANKTIAPAPPPLAPDPASHGVDHYRCVRVKKKPSSPSLPSGFTVMVEDQFRIRQAKLGRATKLCVPTDKNGEGIDQPDLHLLCYKATVTPKTVVDGVQVADQFGSAVHRLRGEDELCVPSTKQLLP